jgi:large subunit ribosomal protein L6
MSRLGKKPIVIPEKVEVKKEDGFFSVKGPLGEIKRSFKNDIEIDIKERLIYLKPKQKTKESAALWGTYYSHLQNMLAGVTKGFKKKLLIEGIGFRAQLEGTKLVLSLGFSHPLKMEVPKDLRVQVEKNIITVSGVDKEKVGQFSAEIRDLKKPEPYKGKGIRYEKEIIRRKSGKKVVATA